MHSLFGTTRGSNPGPFDSNSDINHYSTAPPQLQLTCEIGIFVLLFMLCHCFYFCDSHFVIFVLLHVPRSLLIALFSSSYFFSFTHI